jgi:hypothetical protein
MAIHHINVNPIRAGLFGLVDLFSQAGEVSG